MKSLYQVLAFTVAIGLALVQGQLTDQEKEICAIPIKELAVFSHKCTSNDDPKCLPACNQCRTSNIDDTYSRYVCYSATGTGTSMGCDAGYMRCYLYSPDTPSVTPATLSPSPTTDVPDTKPTDDPSSKTPSPDTPGSPTPDTSGENPSPTNHPDPSSNPSSAPKPTVTHKPLPNTISPEDKNNQGGEDSDSGNDWLLPVIIVVGVVCFGLFVFLICCCIRQKRRDEFDDSLDDALYDLGGTNNVVYHENRLARDSTAAVLNQKNSISGSQSNTYAKRQAPLAFPADQQAGRPSSNSLSSQAATAQPYGKPPLATQVSSSEKNETPAPGPVSLPPAQSDFHISGTNANNRLNDMGSRSHSVDIDSDVPPTYPETRDNSIEF